MGEPRREHGRAPARRPGPAPPSCPPPLAPAGPRDPPGRWLAGSGPYAQSVVTLRIYTMPHRCHDVNTPGQAIDHIVTGRGDPDESASGVPGIGPCPLR